MALYKIELSENVRKKDLSSIPKSDVVKIVKCIESLAENPFPEGAVRLKGHEEWRIRQVTTGYYMSGSPYNQHAVSTGAD